MDLFGCSDAMIGGLATAENMAVAAEHARYAVGLLVASVVVAALASGLTRAARWVWLVPVVIGVMYAYHPVRTVSPIRGDCGIGHRTAAEDVTAAGLMMIGAQVVWAIGSVLWQRWPRREPPARTPTEEGWALSTMPKNPWE